MKTTKKALIELSKHLEATKIANDIYNFENKIDEMYKDNHVENHTIIAYSAGVYGNSGRLDVIIKDGKSYYYCYY